MTQPAKIRDNRAKAKGRAIPPGPKAQVNWDLLDRNEYLSGQHNYDDVIAAQAASAAAERLAQLEANGAKTSAARLRRQINLATEARWAVRSSWCPTCLNVFHNCKCPPPEMPDKVSNEFMDDFNRRHGNLPPTREERREARKAEERRQRQLRKGTK